MPSAAQPELPPLEGRQVGLQGEAGRVLAAGVLETLVLAGAVLNVGRREVDGRRDGARLAVGGLPRVDGEGFSFLGVGLHG